MVVPNAFEAVSVAVFVPAVVGVPVIKPFVLFVRPAGRLVARNVIGAVPLAVTVLLKATPTVPLKELVEVKAGGTPAILVEVRNPVSVAATTRPLGASLNFVTRC